MSSVTKVWRVQNEKGQGPYTSILFISSWSPRDHDAESGHPAPWQDGIDDWSASHRFGFISLEQAKAWFDEDELIKLAEKGYNLVEVEAKSILQGRRQIAFIPA